MVGMHSFSFDTEDVLNKPMNPSSLAVALLEYLDDESRTKRIAGLLTCSLGRQNTGSWTGQTKPCNDRTYWRRNSSWIWVKASATSDNLDGKKTRPPVVSAKRSRTCPLAALCRIDANSVDDDFSSLCHFDCFFSRNSTLIVPHHL